MGLAASECAVSEVQCLGVIALVGESRRNVMNLWMWAVETPSAGIRRVPLKGSTPLTERGDVEPFPPNRTRRRSRCVSIYLSSQPVLPFLVTDRRLGTAAVGVLVTWRVEVLFCELTLVRSDPGQFSSSWDFNWVRPALRGALEGGVPYIPIRS